MAEDMIEFTWPLGDNYDCETCGYTWNEVGLECWDENENLWQLYIRTGCYGGDSVMSNDPQWETKSDEIVKQALMYSDFNKDRASHLRKKLTFVKERV